MFKTDRPDVVMEFGLKPGTEHLYGETLEGFRTFVQQMNYRAFAPWGEDVTDSLLNDYPFWYLFLLPEGAELDSRRAILDQAFKDHLTE